MSLVQRAVWVSSLHSRQWKPLSAQMTYFESILVVCLLYTPLLELRLFCNQLPLIIYVRCALIFLEIKYNKEIVDLTGAELPCGFAELRSCGVALVEDNCLFSWTNWLS